MKTIELPVAAMTIGDEYALSSSSVGIVTGIEWAGRKDHSRIIVSVKAKKTGNVSKFRHDMVGYYDAPAPKHDPIIDAMAERVIQRLLEGV